MCEQLPRNSRLLSQDRWTGTVHQVTSIQQYVVAILLAFALLDRDIFRYLMALDGGVLRQRPACLGTTSRPNIMGPAALIRLL
jgi:hypothetical protein